MFVTVMRLRFTEIFIRGKHENISTSQEICERPYVRPQSLRSVWSAVETIGDTI